MREADMKCKVAACLLSSPPDHFLLLAPSHLPFPRPPATLTRSRKDVPESSFWYGLIGRYPFSLAEGVLKYGTCLPTSCHFSESMALFLGD